MVDDVTEDFDYDSAFFGEAYGAGGCFDAFGDGEVTE